VLPVVPVHRGLQVPPPVAQSTAKPYTLPTEATTTLRVFTAGGVGADPESETVADHSGVHRAPPLAQVIEYART